MADDARDDSGFMVGRAKIGGRLESTRFYLCGYETFLGRRTEMLDLDITTARSVIAWVLYFICFMTFKPNSFTEYGIVLFVAQVLFLVIAKLEQFFDCREMKRIISSHAADVPLEDK